MLWISIHKVDGHQEGHVRDGKIHWKLKKTMLNQRVVGQEVAELLTIIIHKVRIILRVKDGDGQAKCHLHILAHLLNACSPIAHFIYFVAVLLRLKQI